MEALGFMMQGFHKTWSKSLERISCFGEYLFMEMAPREMGLLGLLLGQEM